MAKEYNTGFHNPIDPKEQKTKRYPESLDRNHYDKLSSCFVGQGSNFGMGFNQPVGTDTIKHSDVIPKGRINTMSLYEER